MRKPKAVVLTSGGLDSTTVLALVLSEGYEAHCLSFDYGQRHRAELIAAQRIARHYQVEKHCVIQLSLDIFKGNALTDHTLDVPHYEEDRQEIPVTYIPARNTLFLAHALSYAESIDADAIFIGASAVDYSGYPDCRPDYFKAFEAMANLGTKKGREGQGIRLETPLLALSKAATLQLGTRLGVDYSMTVSCYQANEAGEACGHCDSCGLRIKGFAEAGLPDTTRYQP